MTPARFTEIWKNMIGSPFLLLREREDAERHPLFGRCCRGLRAGAGAAGSGGGGCSTFTARSIIGCVYCAAGIG